MLVPFLAQPSVKGVSQMTQISVLCVLCREGAGVPGQSLRGERDVAAASADSHRGGSQDRGVSRDRHHQRRHPHLQLLPRRAGRLQLGTALQMGSRSFGRAGRARGSHCSHQVRFLLCGERLWVTQGGSGALPKQQGVLSNISLVCFT